MSKTRFQYNNKDLEGIPYEGDLLPPLHVMNMYTNIKKVTLNANIFVTM
jgi:hypothetical protein